MPASVQTIAIISAALLCIVTIGMLGGCAHRSPEIGQGTVAMSSDPAPAAPPAPSAPNAPSVPAQPPVTLPGLAGVRSWGYQLANLRPSELRSAPYDLLVIDYSTNGAPSGALSRGQVEALQRAPDGSRRIVLAYLSIGEAEDYRYYWPAVWHRTPPAWMGQENPDWPGNYAVRYWDDAWQQIIFGSAGAYLDRIIAAGFDGVYLDRVDAYYVSDATVGAARRRDAMIDFVSELSAYADARRPGFLIVAQNGEELLGNARYRAAIDGFAKEDLYYGLGGDGVPNAASDIAASLREIRAYREAGQPVFLVEYVADAAQIARVRGLAAELDAPIFIGSRRLNNARSL